MIIKRIRKLKIHRALCFVLSVVIFCSFVPLVFADSSAPPSIEESMPESEGSGETENSVSSASETPDGETESSPDLSEDSSSSQAEESSEEESEKVPVPLASLNLDITSDSEYNALNSVLAAASSGDVFEITLQTSVTAADAITIPAGVTVYMRGNNAGYVIASSASARHFIVNGTLKLSQGVVLDGGDAAGGLRINSGGAAEIYDATIRRCAAPSGGGVEVTAGGMLSFESEAALITGCFATATLGTGGGVYYASEKSLSMQKGTISNCYAFYGGGVYVVHDNAVFTLGGTSLITGCTTSAYNPYHGSASGESTTYPHGAGVALNRGTLNITSGRIENCLSYGHGGGIYSTSNGTIHINAPSSAAAISRCATYFVGNGSVVPTSAAGHGGGIYSLGTITFQAGIISNCTTTTNGGAMYITGSASALTMSGGTIQNCGLQTWMIEGVSTEIKAMNGGAVCKINGRMDMTGSTIIGCTARDAGGAVYISAAVMTMMGGSVISDSMCTGKSYYAGWGGGIYITGATASASLDGAVISNCTASDPSGNGNDGTYGSGGGIYVNSGSASLTNTTISGCTAKIHGGGIFTKDYTKLNIGANVSFSGNKSLKFYRLPGDNVETDYPNIRADTVSLDVDTYLYGRKHPLNNYDINYLSSWLVYEGNGGTDAGLAPNDIKKRAVVQEIGYLSAAADQSHTVLDNGGANTLFSFQKADRRFGIWSDDTAFSSGSAVYTAGDTFTFTRVQILNPGTLPEKKLYALWQVPVRITKEVLGSFGDQTKDFEINVQIFESDTAPSAYADRTVFLRHNASYPGASEEENGVWWVYDNLYILIDEESYEHYTAAYEISDGVDQNHEDIFVAIDASTRYALADYAVNGNGEVLLKVINTHQTIVPSGISLDSPMVFLLIGGTGLLGFMSLTIFFKRRQYGR